MTASRKPVPPVASDSPASPARQAANSVAKSLRVHGFQEFFVGGCVRDMVRGVVPKDYDIATDALPEQVQQLFPRSLSVGAQFGVVVVLVDEQRVEVATFRSDGLYSDGRRPDEVFYSTDPKEDVLRRDFTVNGLLLDPADGKVLDHVGGLKDMERKVVRAIGEPSKRFQEDHLRMVRAVRFSATLGFEIDPATFQSIQEHAGLIQTVSGERLRDEVALILTSGRARRGMELLDTSGLLEPILPEIAAMKEVEQPPEFHPEGDVWTHTLLMLEALPGNCSLTLALGVLLHDVGKPPTFRVAPERIRFDNHVSVGARMGEQICRRLRLSVDDTRQIIALIENHLRFIDVPNMRTSTLKRFMRLERFEEHMELHRLDCLSSHRNLETYDLVRRKQMEFPAGEIRPARLINGTDLIRLGYEPGPRMGEILHSVEDAQLDGTLSSAEDALHYVQERYPR